MKRHAPATLRNRDAIAAVLAHELPNAGTVVEVASGSGEHVVFFAQRFPKLLWQPSDPDPEALVSIDAYRADYVSDYGGENCLAPIQLDASAKDWPIENADAIVCINMVHISPWAATEGLFSGAATRMSGYAPLILYGPYFEQGAEPAPSNLDFDRSLRARDPSWGIRQIEQVDQLAGQVGLSRTARHTMPANNLMLVYRKVDRV